MVNIEILFLAVIVSVFLSIFMVCQDLISILIYVELFALNLFLYVIDLGIHTGDNSGSVSLTILFIVLMAGESTIVLSAIVNFFKLDGEFLYIIRKIKQTFR